MHHTTLVHLTTHNQHTILHTTTAQPTTPTTHSSLYFLLEQHEQEGHVVAADALGLGGVVGQAVVQQLIRDRGRVLAGVQARAHKVALRG